MADIELVIKIPQKAYNALTHAEFDANLVVNEMSKAIANGTPLPKGHGRLIDESKIKNCGWNFIDHHAKTDAPTIIEAENEDRKYMFHVDLEDTDKTKEGTVEESVLDKIRDEAKELDGKYLIGDYGIYGENIPKYVRLWDVLSIIDKYKSESEV